MIFFVLYRIGYTGRSGRKGLIVSLVDSLQSRRNLALIQNHFNKPILELDTVNFDNLEQTLS